MGIVIFFVIIFILIEIFLICSGIEGYKYYKCIINTPISFVNELSAGIASIEGKVVSLSKKILVSPLCGIQCVYFKFEAYEITGEDDCGFSINDTQYVACGVDDGSGFAETDLSKAKLILEPVASFYSGGFLRGDVKPTLEAILNRYGESSQGLIFAKKIHFKETVLKEGDQVYVLGNTNISGENNFLFTKRTKSKVPLIISDKPKYILHKKYKRKALSRFIGAIIIIGVAIFIFLYFNGSRLA